MRITTLVAISLLAGSAYAQAGGGAPPALKPALELERLKPLEGDWTCKGVVPAGAMGPGSPEAKYTSSFAIKQAWNGFSYTVTYDQKESSPAYSGAWNVAWDGTRKKLLFFWLDVAGNVGLETADNWKGDALVVQGEGFVPAGFVPAAIAGKAGFRDTFTRKGETGMHWKGELKFHGMKTWTTIGDDECVRI